MLCQLLTFNLTEYLPTVPGSVNRWDEQSPGGICFLCRVLCSGTCWDGKHCCHFASKINVSIKVRESTEPVVKCTGKRAKIMKISRNSALATMEIHTIRDENRCLHRQLARVGLCNAMGDQIRKIVDIM